MKKLGEVAIAIGNFDGVHIGHQTIIQKMIKYANEHGLKPVVYTFNPHPREVIGRLTDQGQSFVLINPYKIKNNKIIQMGASVYEEEFNRDFSQMDYRDFLDNIIIQKMNAKACLLYTSRCV